VEALRLHAWGAELRAEELAEPEPRDGELLIEVEACGVGLTVLNCIGGQLGDDDADLPRVPGHEVVGRVVAAGPGAGRERVGERVAAYFYLFCGACPRCLAGKEDLCDNLAGYLGVDRDGGYARRCVLPARNAIRLPEDVDPVLATVIPDAVATPVHVVRLAQIGPGDRVAVVAAGGGVGIHMAQVARAHGADVLGLDVDARKLAYLADELGIATADSSDFGSVALPLRWAGRADVVVDLLGQPATIGWALAVLATGGRLVSLTTFKGVAAPVAPRDLVLRQLSILGSRYATRAEVDHAARLVASGAVRPVVGRRERWDSVNSIHEDLRAGRLLGRGALVW
jgi:D-arabinose 1-dehydrogenase-like Zn-dependent alcohol dehydrogenase